MVRARLLFLRLGIELRNKVEELWASHGLGMWLVFVGTVVAGILLYWPTVPGVGVAVMGIAAALMAARKEPTAWEKAGWIFMMFALFLVEILAIRKDHREHDEQMATLLSEGHDIKTQAQKKFAEIGTDLKRGVQGILDQSQKNFVNTVQQESRHFDATIKTEKESIDQITGGDSFVTVMPRTDSASGNLQLYISLCSECTNSVSGSVVLRQSSTGAVDATDQRIFDGTINPRMSSALSASIACPTDGSERAYRIDTLARNKPTSEILKCRFNRNENHWEFSYNVRREETQAHYNPKTKMAEGEVFKWLQRDTAWDQFALTPTNESTVVNH